MLKHSLLAGLLMGLVLCSHVVGADVSSPVAITVTSKVIQDHFGGVGFHADFSLPWSTPEHFDQVLQSVGVNWNPVLRGFRTGG